MAELEDDDEELPDADEDDNDEDDANDDEDEYDENYDEESGSGLGLQPRNSSSRRKTWDEEHVIEFDELIKLGEEFYWGYLFDICVEKN